MAARQKGLTIDIENLPALPDAINLIPQVKLQQLDHNRSLILLCQFQGSQRGSGGIIGLSLDGEIKRPSTGQHPPNRPHHPIPRSPPKRSSIPDIRAIHIHPGIFQERLGDPGVPIQSGQVQSGVSKGRGLIHIDLWVGEEHPHLLLGPRGSQDVEGGFPGIRLVRPVHICVRELEDLAEGFLGPLEGRFE